MGRLPIYIVWLKKAVRITLSYLFLIVMWLFTVLPIWEIFKTSINPTKALITTNVTLLPVGFSFDSYRELFEKTFFLNWMVNSTVIALATTLCVIGFASMSGYALSRYDFLGKKALLGVILTTQAFPLTMMLLPMFLFIAKLDLFDQIPTLILLYVVFVLPFCIWQMKGYYDAIPHNLELSAMVDGCSRFQAFYRIVFPMALPAVAVSALFAFIGAWSEYIIASIIIETPKRYTLAIGLKEFTDSMTTDWGKYAAASLIISVPVCLFFLFLNRWLIESLNLSGIKS